MTAPEKKKKEDPVIHERWMETKPGTFKKIRVFKNIVGPNTYWFKYSPGNNHRTPQIVRPLFSSKAAAMSNAIRITDEEIAKALHLCSVLHAKRSDQMAEYAATFFEE